MFLFLGAMSVICDVTEYRKCIAELKIPLLNALFDTLSSLCNLLVVPAENIKQILTINDQLVSSLPNMHVCMYWMNHVSCSIYCCKEMLYKLTLMYLCTCYFITGLHLVFTFGGFKVNSSHT